MVSTPFFIEQLSAAGLKGISIRKLVGGCSRIRTEFVVNTTFYCSCVATDKKRGRFHSSPGTFLFIHGVSTHFQGLFLVFLVAYYCLVYEYRRLLLRSFRGR